jgi:glycosyltransferase involved in cell wall biosynthesis
MPMKVLVLCYEYPPLGGGGGRVAKTVAEQLVARGHQVRVQTAGMSHLPKHEVIHGVEVFRAYAFRRYEDRCSVAEMGYFCATSFLPTLQHCRRWQPDVIHAHFAMPTGALAWAAHRFTRTPYVITAHLGDVPGGVPEQTDRLFQIVGPMARRIWRDAAGVTAVSSFVQQLAETAYQRKVARILNGIDLSDARSAPERVGEPPHLVFVGRLNPQKCPLFLIDLLAAVKDAPWRLTLVGDGMLMPAVKQRLEDHALDDRVALPGWLAGPEVQRTLAEADLLLLPSSSEGLPVAAVEALKHGLAVLASDIPGVHDVVEDGINGYRLPVENLDVWSQHLRALLAAPQRLLEMRRASRAKASDFDLARIASEYEGVLRSAAAAAGPQP